MRKYIMYGCIAVIIISMVALLIVTNTKKPLNTIASPNSTSLNTATVKIKNIDLHDANKALNGATFRITDQTKNDSLNTKDFTIVEDGETYVTLPHGNYTIELISPALNYASNTEVKNFTLTDKSMEPFDIVIKSELKNSLDVESASATKSSDLLPTTSTKTNSIFTSDLPSKNPQTDDVFIKYSFLILTACGINFALINTFIYLKKQR